MDKGNSICKMCTKLEPQKFTIKQSLRQCPGAYINQAASTESILFMSAVVLLVLDGITPNAVPTMLYGAALHA